MNCQVFEELPPRTPADGCESIDTKELMDVSYSDTVPSIKIQQVSLDIRNTNEHSFRRRFLNRNMELFRLKRASLKRKDSFLYRRHKQIKNRLHDFLNSAFCKENVINGSCSDQSIDQQNKMVLSTPKQKSTGTQTRASVNMTSSPGLLTILKRGKKCTFC